MSIAIFETLLAIFPSHDLPNQHTHAHIAGSLGLGTKHFTQDHCFCVGQVSLTHTNTHFGFVSLPPKLVSISHDNNNRHTNTHFQLAANKATQFYSCQISWELQKVSATKQTSNTAAITDTAAHDCTTLAFRYNNPFFLARALLQQSTAASF